MAWQALFKLLMLPKPDLPSGRASVFRQMGLVEQMISSAQTIRRCGAQQTNSLRHIDLMCAGLCID